MEKDEKMIERLAVEMSYCDQCRRPTIVGVFKILRWQHTIRLCSTCLRSLADEIDLNVRGEG